MSEAAKAIESLSRRLKEAHERKECGGPDACARCASILATLGVESSPLLKLLHKGKPRGKNQ